VLGFGLIGKTVSTHPKRRTILGVFSRTAIRIRDGGSRRFYAWQEDGRSDRPFFEPHGEGLFDEIHETV
jgi:hypothetical protein